MTGEVSGEFSDGMCGSNTSLLIAGGSSSTMSTLMSSASGASGLGAWPASSFGSVLIT